MNSRAIPLPSNIIERNIRECFDRLNIKMNSISVADFELVKMLVTICGRGLKIEQTEYIYDFVVSKNIYSEYLSKMYDMHHNNFSIFYRSRGNIYLTNEVCRSSDTKEAYKAIERFTVALFAENIMEGLENHIAKLTQLITATLTLSKLNGIKELIRYTNDSPNIYLIKTNITSIIIKNSSKIKVKVIGRSGEYLGEMCNILCKLRRKNIDAYLKKLAILGGIDSDEYKEAIFVEFMAQTFFIYNFIGEKYIGELEHGQIKSIVSTMNEFGIESKQFTEQMSKIRQKKYRREVVNIRKKYRYITGDILSDDEVIFKTSIELAGLNYKLKMQAEGRMDEYYRTYGSPILNTSIGEYY